MNPLQMDRHELADRIAQLEAELAEARRDAQEVRDHLEASTNAHKRLREGRSSERAERLSALADLADERRRLARFGTEVMAATGRMLTDPERVTDIDVVASAVETVRREREAALAELEEARKQEQQWRDHAAELIRDELTTRAQRDEARREREAAYSHGLSKAAYIVRQGCGFAPPHGKCDHETIAVAIEGYRDGGMDGMIAALDRLKAAALDDKGKDNE